MNDVIVYTPGDTSLTPELANVQSSIYSLPKFGDNEDSVHSLVDAMILNPIRIVGEGANCNFRINRNGADSTGATVRNLRPDVLLWLPSGVLAFKGEDKAQENERDQARNELMSKLNCFSDAFFGRVPYQICYAVGGTSLEFVVISRNGGVGRPTLLPLTQPMDLSKVRGRSLCVRYAVNIARVLVSLQQTFPEGSVVRLGARVKTETSFIEIFGTFARKKTCHYTGENVLKELYSLINQSRPPSLVSTASEDGFKIRRGTELTVRIMPVGFCNKTPDCLVEVKIAGRSILGALEWLHDNGYVHRDIRPANVMLAEGRWYLMDLEWANTIDSKLEHYRPSKSFLPPELAGVDGEKWTSACDMWQFGKLMKLWGTLDEQGRFYVSVQAANEPGDRLSAADSLHHEFFQ